MVALLVDKRAFQRVGDWVFAEVVVMVEKLADVKAAEMVVEMEFLLAVQLGFVMVLMMVGESVALQVGESAVLSEDALVE